MYVMAEDEILDAQQVADMLKIHVRTVTRWAEEPDSGLDGFKLGDLWRFYRSDIDKFIQLQRKKAQQRKLEKKQRRGRKQQEGSQEV